MQRPVLIAEADTNDLKLLLAAFESAGVQQPVVVVRDGQEAMDYLSAPDKELPHLVITELKMPRCDGFALLEWIKKQPHLERLPVVVLTASRHQADRAAALLLGARGYFVKPVSFEKLVELVGEMTTV